MTGYGNYIWPVDVSCLERRCVSDVFYQVAEVEIDSKFNHSTVPRTKFGLMLAHNMSWKVHRCYNMGHGLSYLSKVSRPTIATTQDHNNKQKKVDNAIQHLHCRPT
jgi:hypothetical protein